MTDTEGVYNHPGITEPGVDKQPTVSGVFAVTPEVVNQPDVDFLGERIDLAQQLADAGIEDVFELLDKELIGLAPVKTRIREIAALLLVADGVAHALRQILRPAAPEQPVPQAGEHHCFSSHRLAAIASGGLGRRATTERARRVPSRRSTQTLANSGR